MHIVEKDEEVDWYIFNTKGLPDDAGHGEYTKALGNRHWAHLHSEADNYGCHACKYMFQVFISTIHDAKNVDLGKGVYDPEKFTEGVKYIDEMYAKWIKEGRPLHKESPATKHLRHANETSASAEGLATELFGLVH